MAIFPPPPVQGLGTVGGFKLYVEDRDGARIEELYKRPDGSIGGLQGAVALGVFSSFQVNVPQIDAHVDREQGEDVWRFRSPTCSRRCRSISARSTSNDFNRFGRTYQVNVQAESSFRMQPEQIGRLKTRNAAVTWCRSDPSLQVTRGYGPDHVMHYNGYPAAESTAAPAPGFSSGQAERRRWNILAANAAERA